MAAMPLQDETMLGAPELVSQAVSDAVKCFSGEHRC